MLNFKEMIPIRLCTMNRYPIPGTDGLKTNVYSTLYVRDIDMLSMVEVRIRNLINAGYSAEEIDYLIWKSEDLEVYDEPSKGGINFNCSPDYDVEW